MIINVRAIRTKREKEISKIIKFSKDPLTGIHFGLVSGELPDGNVRWRGIYLTDFNSFNIENDLEAKCYAVLRMHPALKGCPFVTTEEPTFEILDPNEIANEEFAAGMELGKALQIIKNMRTNEVIPFARFMDLTFDDAMASNRFVKSLLVRAAKVNAKDFIRNYYDQNRPLFELISMAKHFGVITFDIDSGHTIGKTGLGYSTHDVARTLEANTSYVARIRAKLEERGAKLNDDEKGKDEGKDEGKE